MAKRAATSKKSARADDDAPSLAGAAQAGGGGGREGHEAEAPPIRAQLNPVTLLDQVIGQRAALDVLTTAMTSGRVHHAWIFAGPSGVGKRSTAIAFGAALLDPTTTPDLSGRPAPDPASRTQEMLRTGLRHAEGPGIKTGHPDLHIITKELAAVSREDIVRKGKQTTLAKDVIEEFLTEPATRKRIVSSGTTVGKVFIVDEAELMNAASQNALLKTLEEPPEGTVIILVTGNDERLLPTIRSRCQRVRFELLEEDAMKAWLSRCGLAVDPGTAPWLIKFAAGSPGAAVLALEHDLLSWQSSLEPLLSATDKGAFVPELGGVLAKLVDERAAQAVKANRDASKDAANKAWARVMLGFLGERTRQRLRARAAQLSPSQLSPGVAKVPEGDAVIDRCLHVLKSIEECERQIAGNVSLGLAFEGLSAQMIAEPVAMY